MIHVQPGQLQERLGAAQVFATAGQQGPLRLVWAGGGDSGPLVAGYAAATDCRVEIAVKPADPEGSIVLPRRWVVEHTFGWLGKYRRLAGRDFETTPASSEA